jgi:hypothetical protein
MIGTVGKITPATLEAIASILQKGTEHQMFLFTTWMFKIATPSLCTPPSTLKKWAGYSAFSSIIIIFDNQLPRCFARVLLKGETSIG